MNASLISEVNASAARWDLADSRTAQLLASRHERARDSCQKLARQGTFNPTLVPSMRSSYLQRYRERLEKLTTLETGGWCLGALEVNAVAMGRVLVNNDSSALQTRIVRLSHNLSYRLPSGHVPADALIVALLLNLTSRETYRASSTQAPSIQTHATISLSINDFGAGVGQYGAALLAARPWIRWRGYDGAGDVEEYTRGFVKFVDLAIPLALPRADWVVALEVCCRLRGG